MDEPNNNIDLYIKLADRARNRFQSLRDIEWKINLGLWGFLISAIAFVCNSDYFRSYTSGVLFWGGLVLTLSIIVLHVIWLQYIHETHQRDNRTSYWWECKALNVAEVSVDGLPPDLSPPADWPRPASFQRQTKNQSEPTEEAKNWCWAIMPRCLIKCLAKKLALHEAHIMILTVTGILSLSLILVLFNRYLEQAENVCALPNGVVFILEISIVSIIINIIVLVLIVMGACSSIIKVIKLCCKRR